MRELWMTRVGINRGRWCARRRKRWVTDRHTHTHTHTERERERETTRKKCVISIIWARLATVRRCIVCRRNRPLRPTQPGHPLWVPEIVAAPPEGKRWGGYMIWGGGLSGGTPVKSRGRAPASVWWGPIRWWSSANYTTMMYTERKQNNILLT